jgi:hypothetical protein
MTRWVGAATTTPWTPTVPIRPYRCRGPPGRGCDHHPRLAATRNARRAGEGLVAAAVQAARVIAEPGRRPVRHRPAGRPRPQDRAPALSQRRSPAAGAAAPRQDGQTLAQPGPRAPGSWSPDPNDPRRSARSSSNRATDFCRTPTASPKPATHGAEFGLDRLVDLAERHHHDGLPAPETLRRVARAVLEYQRGHLQDDATLLLLEWSANAPTGLLPTI